MAQTFDRPGIFLSETLAIPQSNSDVNLSNAVFLGPTKRGPVGVQAMTTYPDFQRRYGMFTPGVTPSALEYAVWQYFNNTGRNAFIIRVLNGDEVVATTALANRVSTGQINEVQTITISGVPTGGSFALTFSGQTTGPIAYNATAAAVRTALAALSSVNGTANIAVTGSAAGPYTVTFQGALAGTDVPSIITDGTLLSGGTAPMVVDATPTPGVGPTRQTALVVNAQNPGAWGNSVYIAITDSVDFGSTIPATRFNITVYYKGVALTNIVDRIVDVSLDPTDPRYVLGIVNDPVNGSAWISVALPSPLPVYTSVVASDLIPAATVVAFSGVVQPVPLLGGVDTITPVPTVATYTTAFGTVDQLSNPVGISLPGVTDAPTVNALLGYCATRGDAFAVVDGRPGGLATDQVTLSLTYTANGLPTSYGATYYPRVIFADPASNAPSARVTLPISGAVLGRYAATDSTVGVFGTAAGDTAQISGAVALETALSAADLTLLNKNGVNAVRNKPGSGIVLYGARTLKRTNQADRYIAVRRSLIYIKAQVDSRLQPYVFAPNRPITWQQMQNVINQFLMDFWISGGLEGATSTQAFYVICDETNNTQVTVAAGEVHMDIGVATVTPAEFIAINISQFDGSVTVTDSAS